MSLCIREAFPLGASRFCNIRDGVAARWQRGRNFSATFGAEDTKGRSGLLWDSFIFAPEPLELAHPLGLTSFVRVLRLRLVCLVLFFILTCLRIGCSVRSHCSSIILHFSFELLLVWKSLSFREAFPLDASRFCNIRDGVAAHG